MSKKGRQGQTSRFPGAPVVPVVAAIAPAAPVAPLPFLPEPLPPAAFLQETKGTSMPDPVASEPVASEPVASEPVAEASSGSSANLAETTPDLSAALDKALTDLAAERAAHAQTKANFDQVVQTLEQVMAQRDSTLTTDAEPSDSAARRIRLLRPLGLSHGNFAAGEECFAHDEDLEGLAEGTHFIRLG